LDFSDNDITRLEGFPLLTRLSTLLLNNNRVTSIATGLGTKIPNLESLVLTGNRIENLADLDPLTEFKKLQNLSLLRNPVSKTKHYRLYVIFKIPSLRAFDFQKVKAKERAEAAKLFDNETGAQLVSSISQMKSVPSTTTTTTPLTEEQKQKIQEMIAKATSSEEIQRLDRALRSGKIPKSLEKGLLGSENNEGELDEGQDQNGEHNLNQEDHDLMEHNETDNPENGASNTPEITS
jgi:U2 small nuclear ribonucleoprotein A'